MMNREIVVLVDDGSCPRGQIKQVRTGLATGGLSNPYGAVERKCIASSRERPPQLPADDSAISRAAFDSLRLVDPD
jgi:hypothetical protein